MLSEEYLRARVQLLHLEVIHGHCPIGVIEPPRAIVVVSFLKWMVVFKLNHFGNWYSRCWSEGPKVVAACSRQPARDAVILLEHAAIYNTDWYERLTAQAGRVCKRGGRQGIVAGMHLDAVELGTRGLAMPSTGSVRFATAQCYLIRRPFFEEQQAWYGREDHERKNFDKNLCLGQRGRSSSCSSWFRLFASKSASRVRCGLT